MTSSRHTILAGVLGSALLSTAALAAAPRGLALSARPAEVAGAAALLPDPRPDGRRFAIEIHSIEDVGAEDLASAVATAGERADVIVSLQVPRLDVADGAAIAAWEERVQALASAAGPRVAAWLLHFENDVALGHGTDTGAEAADLLPLAFVLKRTVVAVRAHAPAAAVALDVGTGEERFDLEAAAAEGIAPFVDAYLHEFSEVREIEQWRADIATHDPGAALWVPGHLGDLIGTTADLEIAGLDEDDSAPDRDRRLLALADRALPAGAQATGIDAVRFPPEVSLTANAFVVPSDLSTRVVFRPQGKLPAARMIAHLEGGASNVRLFDSESKHEGPVKTIPEPGGVAIELPLVSRALVLAFDPPAEEESPREESEEEVTAAAEYTLEEILARHFERVAHRKAQVRSFIADVSTEMRYDLGSSGQKFFVRVEGRYYESDDGTRELENQRFFLNGAPWSAKAGEAPEIPLLQPEKVTVVPLEVTLDKTYDYSLDGKVTRDGRPAWKLRFDPATGAAGYSGTVYVDAETWDRLEIDLVQTGLEPPIISNAQEDRSGAAGDAWLIHRSDIQRLVTLVGATVNVDLRTTFTNHRVNPDDFAEQLASARASDNQMLRDTDEGLKYLRRNEEGGRDVVETSSRKLFVLGGVRYDKSYGVIPLGGVNWLDADFGEDHLQINLFLAGAINTVSISDPSLFGSKVSGTVDAFLPFIRQRDRLSLPGAGVDDETIVAARLPEIDLEAGIPMGHFGRLLVNAEIEHQNWKETDDTSVDFAPPSDTFVGTFGVQAEYQRHRWDARAWAKKSLRSEWEPWGPLDGMGVPTMDTPDSYVKWGARIGKRFPLPKFQELGFEAEYVGGDDLDRFSQYEFTPFGGTRLPGFDGTGLHFDEAIIARVSYGFQIAGVFGVDLIAGWARTRNESSLPAALEAMFGDTSDQLGVSIGGSLPGPKRTLIRFEIGLPVSSSDHDDLEGDFIAQVVVLKLLK